MEGSFIDNHNSYKLWLFTINKVEVDVNLCYCSTQNCNQVMIWQILLTFDTFFTNDKYFWQDNNDIYPFENWEKLVITKIQRWQRLQR